MSSIGFSRKFDKDVSSIISSFLVEKPYKIKDCFLIKNCMEYNYRKFIYNVTKNTSPYASRYIKDGLKYYMDEYSKNKQLNYWWPIVNSVYFSKESEKYTSEIFNNDVDSFVLNKIICNPAAINILEKNINKIDLNVLCENPHPDIVKLLEDNLDKVNISSLYKNKNAMSSEKICKYIIDNYKHVNEILGCSNDVIVNEFLKIIVTDNNTMTCNLDNIGWEILCKNTHPSIVKLIEKNFDVIFSLENNIDCIVNLCINSSTIHIIEKNIDTIFNSIENDEWIVFLCENPSAVHIIEKNINIINSLHYYDKKSCWFKICKNTHKNAIQLIEKNINIINSFEVEDREECFSIICENSSAIEFIEKNLDKIDWNSLCRNPSAIHIIEKNLDKITFDIYCNSSIFETDTDKYKKNINEITNEIYNL